MSKKYREEIDKIVMTDDMKKRILQNVLSANENSEVKNNNVEITVPKVIKYNNLKRNMQMIVAGFTVILCLSIAKNYPMLIKDVPNDLEQNETVKNHDDENNSLKISDDNQFVYNKDSKEISNDNKKDQILDQNNNSDDHVKEENNTSSETGKEEKNKDKLQSNSGSEVVKDKSIGNPNISSKTSPEEDVNNKENRKPTGTKQKTKDGDIMENKVSGNNADNSISSTSAVAEKNVNYNREYKTLDEAEKELNLKINLLKNLPKGFKMEIISVISNEIIQVEYNDGDNNIIFRAGKGIDNISGDYNAYQVKDTVKVNGLNVNLQGNKSEEYNLSQWEKDGISYSISIKNGIDEQTILDMIF